MMCESALKLAVLAQAEVAQLERLGQRVAERVPIENLGR